MTQIKFVIVLWSALPFLFVLLLPVLAPTVLPARELHQLRLCSLCRVKREKSAERFPVKKRKEKVIIRH